MFKSTQSEQVQGLTCISRLSLLVSKSYIKYKNRQNWDQVNEIMRYLPDVVTSHHKDMLYINKSMSVYTGGLKYDNLLSEHPV